MTGDTALRFAFRRRFSHFDGAVMFAGFLLVANDHIGAAFLFIIAGTLVSALGDTMFEEA